MMVMAMIDDDGAGDGDDRGYAADDGDESWSWPIIKSMAWCRP